MPSCQPNQQYQSTKGITNPVAWIHISSSITGLLRKGVLLPLHWLSNTSGKRQLIQFKATAVKKVANDKTDHHLIYTKQSYNLNNYFLFQSLHGNYDI